METKNRTCPYTGQPCEYIILGLCGGTGSWSRPYQEAGYNVQVITLPKYDVTKLNCEGGAIYYIDKYGYHQVLALYKEVYGILAAPPCTEFPVAKGARPRDFAAGMEAVEACLRIIWNCRMYGNLKFWALENPRGLLRQFLGVPHYTFEQWQFGGDKRKPTDIWGYFNEPRPTVKQMPAGLANTYGNGTHAKY